MTIRLVAEALARYGGHDGQGTDWGCCAWDDRCWCGYGVVLDLLRGTSQYEDATATRPMAHTSFEYVAGIEAVQRLIAGLREELS